MRLSGIVTPTDVKVGQYHVTAQAQGFSTIDTAPFRVQVAARQRVDVTLRAGASETVTVSDAAALLDTDDSERGQVIGTREVENLPFKQFPKTLKTSGLLGEVSG